SGIFAVLLLLFHPVFWLGGLLNPVRIFLAAGGLAVAYVAWRAWEQDSSSYWFYASAFLLGVASGFRPDLLIFVSPLVLVTGLRSRRSLLDFAIAGALLSLSAGSWLWFTAAKVGGLGQFLIIIKSYLKAQSEASSLLLGGKPLSAGQMI